MGILRVAKNKNYSVICNVILRDERLSWRARGIAGYLLTQPDDWDINSNSLWRAGTEGRDAVRTAMKELEDLCYLHRIKRQLEDGTWETELVLTEIPEQPTPENPQPTTENQASVNQASVFQALYINTNTKYYQEDPDDSRGESSTVKAKRARKNVTNAAPPLTVPAPPPAKRSRPRKTSNPALADALWETYQASMAQHEPGAVLDIGKERKALNQLADAGTWTPEHLAQCIDAMKADAFWKGQHLAAASIKNQIAAKLAGKVAVQTNGSNGLHRPPARKTFEAWLLDTYGMDNVTIISMNTGKAASDIEMEYQLA